MDTVDKATRSRIMSQVAQRDTGPEIRLRHALHRIGFRYRLNDKTLPGSPDLVFPRFGAVIFAHGCFWHAHGCRFSTAPSTRKKFWLEKFKTNRNRDKRNIDLLLSNGWRVLVVWECALKRNRNNAFTKLVSSIAKWLRSNRRKREIGETVRPIN